MDSETKVHIFDDVQSSRDEITSILDGSGFSLEFHPVSAAINRDYSSEKQYCCMAHIDQSTCDINNIIKPNLSNNTDSIILYSDRPYLSDVVHAIKFGAFNFLKLPLDECELKTSLTTAAEQNSLNLKKLQDIALISSNLTRLTIRENSILELIREGNSNKVIAYHLHISQRTVENHRAHIMHKMSAKTITHLMNMLNTISV